MAKENTIPTLGDFVQESWPLTQKLSFSYTLKNYCLNNPLDKLVIVKILHPSIALVNMSYSCNHT